MKQSKFSAFLKETFQRFKVKTPPFFQVWQTIGMVLLFVTGIPEALKSLYEETGFDFWTMLPASIQVLASKSIAVAGLAIKFMAKMPVKNPEQIIAKTDKLPFTEKTS